MGCCRKALWPPRAGRLLPAADVRPDVRNATSSGTATGCRFAVRPGLSGPDGVVVALVLDGGDGMASATAELVVTRRQFATFRSVGPVRLSGPVQNGPRPRARLSRLSMRVRSNRRLFIRVAPGGAVLPVCTSAARRTARAVSSAASRRAPRGGGFGGPGRCSMGAWPRCRSGICHLRCCCAGRVRSRGRGGRPGPVRWGPRGSRCRAGTPW